MRAQVVALGMQRPAHISFKEHNIPMLTVEDFDIEAIPASDIGSVAGDSKYFQNLAILCIEKAKVCFYISRILSTQYTVSCQIKSQLVPAGIAPMNTLLPKIDNMMSEENRACDKQLQEWYSTRPKEVKQNPSSKELLSTKEGSVMVHQAILDMLYSTAISALHRPQLLHPGLLHPGEPPIYQQESRYIVQREARKITTISGELNRLDLVRYLPGYTITVILPAIMIHLTTIKSGDSTAKQESYEGFCTCMVVMQQLRYTYNSADVITAILQSAIIKAAEDESGHTQSGPGLTDLTHFLNESSPIHHLGIGLTQDGQSGLENSEEFSPLFSSDISNVPNEFYSDDIGEQVSIHATSNITSM